jgi:uncharacterized membrane protein YkvA (DUF1232 family)
MSLMRSWKAKAHDLKTEVYALYLAYRDPRVSWLARIFAALVVAYAFSPIDLIPDPIPVLGYLDDLILIPAGVVLARRMIPAEVLAECRARAKEVVASDKPVNRAAAVAIVAIWLITAGFMVVWLVKVFSS